MKIASLILCLFLSSCATLSLKQDSLPPAEWSQQVNPYTLELIDELYDGEKLFLKIKLEQIGGNTNLTFPTFLAVEAYANGILGSEKYYLLESLEFDQDQSVILSVDAINMSDYQLKLFWGEDAKEYYAKIYPDLIDSLELAEVQVEKVQICKEECQLRYNLNISLKNNSDITIPEAVLLVNLVEDVASTAAGDLPVFQQKIPLKALNLAANSARNLNFVLVEPKDLAGMNLQVQVKLN